MVFRRWSDEAGVAEYVAHLEGAARYLPGQFYRRELPGILAVLEMVPDPLEAVVVDGYVWLDDRDLPGLGGWLYEALAKRVAVVGVAKSRYAGATQAIPVFRGRSLRPLHVTAAGMDVAVAARHILEMHGKHRIPTLLKRVDRLARGDQQLASSPPTPP